METLRFQIIIHNFCVVVAVLFNHLLNLHHRLWSFDHNALRKIDLLRLLINLLAGLIFYQLLDFLQIALFFLTLFLFLWIEFDIIDGCRVDLLCLQLHDVLTL